jgi:hypothetical protein
MKPMVRGELVGRGTKERYGGSGSSGDDGLPPDDPGNPQGRR